MSFTMYTTENCAYCKKTKTLLGEWNQEYINIILDTQEKIDEFKKNTGHKTVPQVYHDSGIYIGGYDDLLHYLLNREK